MTSKFGAVLLMHSLMNEANYSCNCGITPSPRTDAEYVAHFEAALEAAGLQVVER
jgi:hypothetical protein